MVSVGVIGAGPAGLATARVLVANNKAAKVDLFEASDKVGGVWNYESNTAMYDVLETNLSNVLMAYEGFPFAGRKRFPTRQEVQQYLESYWESVIKPNDRVRLFTNTRVTGLEKVGQGQGQGNGRWEITGEGAHDVSVHQYDYVVVANGHFSKPFIPRNIPGLEAWPQESQCHSRDYKKCTQFQDLNVVIVGNGSSATDIATQISTTARQVYQSVKPDAKTNWPDNSIVEVVSQIESVAWDQERSVHLIDGTVLENIDYIIWATGFYYDLPFLRNGKYRSDLFKGQPQGQQKHLYSLYEHIVYTGDHTLFFSLIPANIVPFPLAELQACVIDLCIAGRIPESEIVSPAIEEPTSHFLPTPKDIEYYQHLQGILDKYGAADAAFKPRNWTQKWVDERLSSAELKAQRQKLLVQWAIELHARGQPYTLPPGP
ncbi:thiol-specific monooxygenase [Kluyveromyces marxianus]|nr:thiol-specific monooxygenase [Kluyveromyces marxianus]